MGYWGVLGVLGSNSGYWWILWGTAGIGGTKRYLGVLWGYCRYCGVLGCTGGTGGYLGYSWGGTEGHCGGIVGTVGHCG